MAVARRASTAGHDSLIGAPRSSALDAQHQIVGRGHELQTLHTLVLDVAQGRGAVAWLEGEPGIGKSALLTEGFRGAEPAGCQLLVAACDELSQGLPLRVMLDCLGVQARSRDPRRARIAQFLEAPAAGAGFAGPTPTPAAVERLLGLVDQLCADSPVVLVVDDLQWADEASLLVWQRLSLAVRQVPLLLVGACRPVPRRAALSALRSRLRERDATVLHLDALSPAETDELAAQLLGEPASPGLRRELDRAAGNPLYITELVNALSLERRLDDGQLGDRAPATLTEAVAVRFGFLSDATTDVLSAASLLGTEFSVSDLVVVVGKPARALVSLIAEATASGVLIEAGIKLKFRHPLFRYALYTRMPESLREALHLQAAQALAEAGLPVERIAQQLLLVSEPDDGWSVEWLTATAHELTYRTPTVAFELIGRFVERVPADDPHRDTLDTELATAAFLLARYDEVLRIAGPLLARTADPERAGEASWLLGYTLVRLAQFNEGIAAISDILRSKTLGPAWTARLQALLAMSLICVSRYDEAARIIDDGLGADAERIDRVAAGYALHASSLILYRRARDRVQMLVTIDRALAIIGDDQRTADLRLLLLANRSGPLLELDRLDDAEATLRQARLLGERGGTARLDDIRLRSAECAFELGKWDDARAELDSIAGLFDTRFNPLVTCGLIALIAARRDDRATAGRLLADFADTDLYAADTRAHANYLVIARATVAERDGDHAAALAGMIPVLDREHAAGMDNPHLLYADLVRIAVTAGDSATAAAGAAAASDEATRGGTRYCAAIAAHCQALAEGDPAPVLAAIDTYFRVAARPYDLARALEDAAVLLAQRGELEPARACVNEAVEHYTVLGAIWDVRRAETRLRPLGIRRGTRGPRRRPATGWNALTPTERTVADLVAQGRSNPDIAGELFLSRSTVQTHVSHILAKLGLHSRGQVAVLALNQPTEPDAP